jgi:hypothetical protein
VLDVQQIFGRAGRPQFDNSGTGIIITTHAKLPHYLSGSPAAVCWGGGLMPIQSHVPSNPQAPLTAHPHPHPHPTPTPPPPSPPTPTTPVPLSGMLMSSVPIESKFQEMMVDNLNAELVLGTVTNVKVGWRARTVGGQRAQGAGAPAGATHY